MKISHKYTTLISAAQLRQLLDDRQPVLMMDCSFDLMNPAAGRQQFEAAHIPGAVHVDLDEHLSDKTGPDRASGGRHPLPSRETFAARLRALGLRNGHAENRSCDRERQYHRLWPEISTRLVCCHSANCPD